MCSPARCLDTDQHTDMPDHTTDRLPVTVLSLATETWGTERSILTLAPHLRERGIDLTIACPDGNFSNTVASQGLRTVRLEVPARGGERSLPVLDLLRDSCSVPREPPGSSGPPGARRSFIRTIC